MTTPPTINLKRKATAKDKARLSPHLRSWHTLNEIFMLGTISLDDLELLINLELTGSRRKAILRKLIARYCSTLRTQTLEALPCDII